MTEAVRETHEAVLAALRKDLEAQGFSVQLEPLVPELGGLQPDLIARRGTEVVVAEVKLSGPSYSDSDQLAHMAAAVRRNPGWRFIIATGPGPDEEPSVTDVSRPEEIREMIAEARRLPANSAAAPMVAWAALESALRTTLVSSGRHLPRSASTSQWIQAAAASGLVSPHDEQRLRRFMMWRNRLAHGLRAPSDADATDLAFALDLADHLLEDSGVM